MRSGRIEWTPIGFTALFPSGGGYTRLDTGLNYLPRQKTYIGAGAGVSRFDLDRSFIFARLGQYNSRLGWEVRYEQHYGFTDGSALTATAVLRFLKAKPD
jgi:hypothetical protein